MTATKSQTVIREGWGSGIPQRTSYGPPLNMVTELIASYAEAAGSAIELWLTKLEEHLATHSAAEVRLRATDRGLHLAAAAFQGGLLVSQGEARRDTSLNSQELAAYTAIASIILNLDATLTKD